MENTKAVLERVGQWHVHGAREEELFEREETYGVLFLHREFEIDGAASGIRYSEL